MMRAATLLCRFGLVLVCAATSSLGEDAKAKSAPTTATNAVMAELKGKLVRLSEGSNERVGIRTEAGVVYTVVSNRMSSALFIDTNLLGKTLVLKGRASKPKEFEVTGNLRSLRAGKVHELYYYCEICTIEGIDPGPCMCCRDPVHLIEEPAK
jgi:hypothetical protein